MGSAVARETDSTKWEIGVQDLVDSLIDHKGARTSLIQESLLVLAILFAEIVNDKRLFLLNGDIVNCLIN